MVSATPRHSDNLSFVILQNDGSAATTDLKAWEIGSATITARTDVYTNESNHIGCAITINQNNDDLYAFYLGDPAETVGVTVNMYYKKSTDDGVTWGSQVAYSEAPAGNFQECYTDISVGGTYAGRIGGAYNDKDPSPNEFYWNKVNSITVAGGVVVVVVPVGNVIAKILEACNLY